MDLLAQLLAQGILRPIDVHVARFLERLSVADCPELLIAAAFASRATRQGHTCLPLSSLSACLEESTSAKSAWEDVEKVRRRLLATPVVGRPGADRPLILDKADRLYLLRYFRDEEHIALALLARAQGTEPVEATRAGQLLEALFPDPPTGEPAINWQKTAAALALLKRFVVIAGGPGSGKTYTVARILALQLAMAPRRLRIGLAAPTGKAALRLQESIRAAKAAIPSQLAAAVPDQAQTLHRLLRFQPRQFRFLHNKNNPLHLDLLVLDEASMIDIPLMAAVLDALPAACRIILLGDRDQLASVEAGNLLGDICGSGGIAWSQPLSLHLSELTGAHYPKTAPLHAITDCIVFLQQSYRFSQESGIRLLARTVNSGSSEALLTIMEQQYPDVEFVETKEGGPGTELEKRIDRFYSPLFSAATPAEALQVLNRNRILCALREGQAGVEGVNALAEHLFRRRGVIGPGQLFYRGMPLMIQRNDYSLGLFNGDTGILWPDERRVLHAWFATEDGLRCILPVRLPPWQTAYAITVHKSQGSEFEDVLLLLPETDAPVVTAELIYTAVTRARKTIVLVGGHDVLLQAVQRRVVRFSGLADQLRQVVFSAEG